MQKETSDFHGETACGQKTWEHSPTALYERRGAPVLNIVVGALMLLLGLAAIPIGRAYWFLFLLFYTVGTAVFLMGLFHTARPILRREGGTLIGVSCGFIPKEHRLPHTALKDLKALPAIGTKKNSKFLRYYIEMDPCTGKKIDLGERHLCEKDIFVLEDYLAPKEEQTDEKETAGILWPLFIVELVLIVVGLFGLSFSFSH
ncbi:MAG: hypothetical protein LKE53_02570 [Oscillospiraceae bacterium]|nr:hypothetical protein [Oscillospiraceae bacterium]MDD3260966.1 hypothetical protein [Oscillospiraceae bacterium]